MIYLSLKSFSLGIVLLTWEQKIGSWFNLIALTIEVGFNIQDYCINLRIHLTSIVEDHGCIPQISAWTISRWKRGSRWFFVLTRSGSCLSFWISEILQTAVRDLHTIWLILVIGFKCFDLEIPGVTFSLPLHF
jgi:hypothetical protein